MSGHPRLLQVSSQRCIGCRACATVCPAGFIALTDHNASRTLHFAATCDKDCSLCVSACPTAAITLSTPIAQVAQQTDLQFPLRPCTACGAPVATPQMLDWLTRTMPSQVHADASGRGWLDLCPHCRQTFEAQQVAREGLLIRGR